MTPEEFGALQQSHSDLKASTQGLIQENKELNQRFDGLRFLVGHMRDEVSDSTDQIQKLGEKVRGLGDALASNTATTSRVEQALGVNSAATARVEQNTRDLVEAFSIAVKAYKVTAFAGRMIKEWAWLPSSAVVAIGYLKGWWSKFPWSDK